MPNLSVNGDLLLTTTWQRARFKEHWSSDNLWVYLGPFSSESVQPWWSGCW